MCVAEFATSELVDVLIIDPTGATDLVVDRARSTIELGTAGLALQND